MLFVQNLLGDFAINQSSRTCPQTWGLFLHNTFYSSPKQLLQLIYIHSLHTVQKIKVKQHNPQNLSLHLFLGLLLGLFPATCPFLTLFTRLPSFSITFSLHTSCLLFTSATTASCFNLSLITLFLTHTTIWLHLPHSSEFSFLQLAVSSYPCPSTPMSHIHTPGSVLPLHYILSSWPHYSTPKERSSQGPHYCCCFTNPPLQFTLHSSILT